MAGSIISTPAIGASSWESWITQQGATDTGFMRVSLTNFSSTAASLIGTGSVLECAGSIYTFADADAILLEDGTASADVAIYYVAVPSTDTTVTVYMEGTAPTWVDSKQGFYQSAASLNRYLGGAYIGTALTYYTKYLYTGENLVYCLQTGETRPLLKKIYEIGEWDMDADAYVFFNVEGSHSKIRSVKVLIRKDASYPLQWIQPPVFGAGGTAEGITIDYYDGNKFWITRAADGHFDSAAFDGTASTVANRGFVYITYEA